MAKTLALPPPYQGEFDRLPLAATETPYCERCENYNLDSGNPTLRKGDAQWADGEASLFPDDMELSLLESYQAGGTSSLVFLASDPGGGFVALKAGTIGGGDFNIDYETGSAGALFLQSLLVQDRLYAWAGTAPTLAGGQIYYNASGWQMSATGFTFSSGFKPFGGCVYKSRAYIISKESTSFCYGGISAVQGATVDVDLTGLMSRRGYLYGIRSISLSEGIEQENVLAFVFSSGEVLVYRGNYPDDVNTWGIVGRFLIPKPIYYNSFVDASGDSYVITEGGLVSLRGLFATGQGKATDEGITAAIPNRWGQIMAALYGAGVSPSERSRLCCKGHYDSANDRIIVCFPSHVSRAGVVDTTKFLRLVYSLRNGSWTEHVGTTGRANATVSLSAMHDDALYYGISVYSDVYKAEGHHIFADGQTNDNPVGYAYNLRSAPLPTEKFGVHKMAGVEVLMKSDLYAQTSFKLIGDLGAEETAAQTTSGNGTNVSKAFVNAGITAGYCQLDISGTTTDAATVGQEIYGLNLWSDDGGLR